MHDLYQQLITYLRAIWANRWIGLLAAWIVCCAGWLVVYALPDKYEASARFYVDASSRLREVVQNLGMEPDVTSRVFLVRQAMMGRPQLEKVARETDLDVTATTPEQHDELLNTLRKNISIGSGNRKEAQNLFQISFVHQDRETAERVVTALLNAFLDDVLKQKDTDSERTQEFLNEQLDYYRGLLEATELELQIFKRQHAGFVVGDRGDYFSRKQSQEQRLEELISSRQVEATKRDELRRQLASVNPHGIVEDGSGRAVIPGNETSQRISELERARRDLLLRVTELHPDVRALEEQIAQLSVQLDAELARTIGRARQDGAASASNPVYVEIQIALSNANLKIAGLDGEIENVRNTISTLTQEVDEAPELESQFVQLSRDYENYQSLYNEVLNQAERERIGRVGGEKDVISFNIIEPPRATFEPVSPNRPMLLTLVLLIGLGVGAALPLMLWLIKPTVHKASDLQEMFPFPVLGSLSLDMRRARNSNFESLMLFGIASSSLILCFVSLLVLQDFIFAPSPTQG